MLFQCRESRCAVLLLAWRPATQFRFFPVVIGTTANPNPGMTRDQLGVLVTKHLQKDPLELPKYWCLGSGHPAQKAIGVGGLDAALRAVFDDHAEDVDPEFDSESGASSESDSD